MLYALAYRVHDPREGGCVEVVPLSNELLGNLVAEDAAVICEWQHKVRLWRECDDDDAAVAVELQVEGAYLPTVLVVPLSRCGCNRAELW